MSMFDSLRVSASGMTAERLRMDVIADNLANADTTRGPNGGPYRRKEVVLESGGAGSFDQVLAGVHAAGIVEDQSPLRRVYDPGHPDADAQGYVTMPNVNSVTEMVDLVTSTRGYEADVTAMNQAKQMFLRTLDLLR
jgi:flagellar basal-body rod protein FlgC